MPNRTTPNQTPNKKNPASSTSGKAQDRRDPRDIEREGDQRRESGAQDSDVERVEIGDPVPENERTTRASRSNRGETGEDEDLPDDDGGIEGTRPRH